ncbi:hypothetical protein [Hydrogenophaga soli]
MTKYWALGLSATAVAVLAVAGWSVFDASSSRLMPPRMDAPELKPLSPKMVDDQQRLSEGIEALVRLGHSDVAWTVPSPLVAVPVPGSDVVGSIQMPRRSMSLFLESLVDERDIVILDEQKVQAGARLSEGGRLTKVQPYQITVREQQGQQRLELPLEQLQVGTLRWADGTPASVATQVYRNGPPTLPKVEAAK